LALLLYSVLKIGSQVLLQHTKALCANPLTQRQLTLRARGKQRDVYTNGVMYLLLLLLHLDKNIFEINENS
jgi:hypothetical protein